MHLISLINKRALILSTLALLINGIFLYTYNPKVYFAITQAHGQIGYNLYKHNMIGMNPELTDHMRNQMNEQGHLVDYDMIADQEFSKPTEPFPINDTIGYGVLLGLLWKMTHSLRFANVQLLQIAIFCILMLFYYQVAYLLFGCAQIAFLCGIMQVFFFPLISYNVMPVRDIWAYYGLLMLCYAVLSYVHNHISRLSMSLCMVFFSICLWIRPTLFCAAVMMTLFLMGYASNKIVVRKRCIELTVGLWLVMGLLFWLPCMYFNVKQYNRLLVSPAGQSLLEGLGELPNQWGHQLSDEYVNVFVRNKYGYEYGTVAFDEAAMHEFKQCVKDDPWHFIKTLLYRLPDILLPSLQWIFYEQSPYAHCTGMMNKLSCALSSLPNIIDFFLRHMWMRLYLLFGYMGLYIMLRKKRYIAVSFVLACVLSGLSTYPSHIEYRYIVPFYWVLSFCVGYAVYALIKRLFCKKYMICLCGSLIRLPKGLS